MLTKLVPANCILC